MEKINSIFVNQVGYKSEGKKQAFIGVERLEGWDEKNPSKEIAFEVVTQDGKVVYSGVTNPPKKNDATGEYISVADFSSVKDEGLYFVRLPETKNESYKFSISPKVFEKTYSDTVHFFYLQRCGMEIKSAADGGKWNHPCCHMEIADIYGEPGKKKLVTGGWHDAGDYGRYVIATVKTAMDLLLASENINDTEKSAALVDEVRYGMEWLLQMQREDGGVYHKITGYHFPGFILPHEEKITQVLAPVSTTATADFAGCLAYAYKFFVESDKVFAEKMLSAAMKAQNYLDTHEDEFYENPKDITTGGYGDKNPADERFFALAALYVVTKKPEYLEKAMNIRREQSNKTVEFFGKSSSAWFVAYSWACVSGYGIEILLRAQMNGQIELSQEDVKVLREDIINKAEWNLKTSEKNPFGVCIEAFPWGSNGAVCDEAHIMLLAYELTGKKEYLDASLMQLDYVLGCNPLNICYVTGSGSNSPQNLHHRPSGALKASMPGMIAGGPCQWLADQTAKNKLQGKPPMQCYLDNVFSYSTNEIDIYWNSPLVYLLSKVI